MTETKLKFSEIAGFSPKQSEASKMLNRFKFLLYGGAMFGGKSYWLRWQLLKLLLKWGAKGYKNVRVGLFSEDYPTLKDRQLCKVKFEFPEWLGKYKEQDHEFVLAPEYGSEVLCFRNLDDPAKYASAEFAAIGVEELTKNPRETFTALRHRLRWTDRDSGDIFEDCKFIAVTNPGDIGHGWVKDLFIDHVYDENETEADLFGFIQALATDNPFLSKSYQNTLDSLPEEQRKAFRDGSWNVFKGQFFKEFRATLHNIRFYNPTKLDQVFASMDWGLSPDAFSYHLHAVKKVKYLDARKEIKTFDRIITFAELYGRDKLPNKWSPEIKAAEKGNEPYYRYADPSAGNKHPFATVKEDSGTSVLEEFDKEGLNFIRANNDRKQGYQSMHQWMSIAPDGLPYWQITDACPQLLKQLPAAIYDPNNSFLIKEGGEDHAIADCRYFLISRPFNIIVIKEKMIEGSSDWYDLMEKKQFQTEQVYV